MYGLGNWPAVAEHVGVKSKEAVRAHYRQIYLLSKHFPEPEPAPQMANVPLLYPRSSILCLVVKVAMRAQIALLLSVDLSVLGCHVALQGLCDGSKSGDLAWQGTWGGGV